MSVVPGYLIRMNHETCSNGSVEHTLSQESYAKTVLPSMLESRSIATFFKTSCFPTRTNTIKNLKTDLLAPTYTHKVNTVIDTKATDMKAMAFKIVISALAILWDMATLPIRIATYLLGFASKEKPENHPLFKALIAEEVLDKACSCVESGKINITLEVKYPGGEKNTSEKRDVNLIPMPQYSKA